MYTLLQRRGPTDQHQRLVLLRAIPITSAPSILQEQLGADPSAEPAPLLPGCGQRVHDLAPFLPGLEGESIQLRAAEDIRLGPVAVQDDALRRLVAGGLRGRGAQDLEDGRDAGTRADHYEAGDVPVLAVDGAAARAVVGEVAHGALDGDRGAGVEGVERLGHGAAGAVGRGWTVDLDQHGHAAFVCRARDGGVGADDGVASHWGGEAEHKVLTGGETEELLGKGEGKVEDPCVLGY